LIVTVSVDSDNDAIVEMVAESANDISTLERIYCLGQHHNIYVKIPNHHDAEKVN
jgi:hypothetical protein